MVTYIWEHKEWIFSGIGVIFFTGFCSLVRLIVKHFIFRSQLRRIPPNYFDYPYRENEYWPYEELSIVEPNQEFLSNCSIKTHSLLLKKLKKSIGIYETLIWLDVDKFSQINECFGRKCGDEIIHKILMIMATVVNELHLRVQIFHADKRDEFYIVGPTNQLDRWVATVFITAIQRYDWSSLVPNLFVTCSAGIALYKKNSTDTLKRARVSLNLIKAKGGNGIGPEISALNPRFLIDLNVS